MKDALVSAEMIMEAQEQLFGNADALQEKYAEYLTPVKTFNPGISDLTLATTAVMMENTRKWLNRMDETTQSINVGSFIHHGFELLAAVFPSLIANEVVSVQPMTRRIGEVFFLEFLYGSNRGNVAKGDKMYGYNYVGNKNTFYTAENGIEENIGTGDGVTKTFAGFINSIPVVAGSFTATDTVETFTEPTTPNGTLVGDKGGSGTINSSNGQFSVTFKVAPVAAVIIVATFDLDFQKNPDLIPEVDISITSQSVTAQNKKLRARYTLDAGYDVEQAWGRSVDNELKAALASEIRMETDGEILNQIATQATAPSYSWSRTPDANIAWADHKWAFYDKAVLPASGGIFETTAKVEGNFIVAGTDVCTVIESLAPQFKSENSMQPGPHYIGTLGEFRVYKNPYYAKTQWVMGYKGTMFLEAGFIWAPYLPLYTTRTTVLDDTVARFGMLQSSARKMINSNFYSKNIIS
jgi:hypothetical protein